MGKKAHLLKAQCFALGGCYNRAGAVRPNSYKVARAINGEGKALKTIDENRGHADPLVQALAQDRKELRYPKEILGRADGNLDASWKAHGHSMDI